MAGFEDGFAGPFQTRVDGDRDFDRGVTRLLRAEGDFAEEGIVGGGSPAIA